MYDMVDKEYIRKRHYIDGWSIRELSKRLNMARQTVRKMLLDAEVPSYELKSPRTCPVMDEHRTFIEQILEDDLLAPPKQRHTSIRIYERLVDEFGFQGGASTVRHFLKKLKKESNECFLKLEANPGEQVQVDFGHAEIIIDQKRVKACLFCMRFKFSSVPFVIAFPTERLEAFLEGHVRAFQYFGGIPKEGLYDNATTQVVKVLSGPEREEHQWFSSLRSHYLFDSHFCQPGKGNEKGSVESLVKYVRSRALVPVPTFSSWDECNDYLLRWCEKERERHGEAWSLEQKHLRPLPELPFSSARPLPVKVNSYALVTVDRNQYSVPSIYAGQMIIAKLYVDRINLVHGNEQIATHPRSYKRNEVRMEIGHYLNALERKPHAVTHASVVRQLPPLYQQLREYMSAKSKSGYKDFLAVLLLLREFSLSELTGAIEQMELSTVTATTVRQHLLPVPAYTEQLAEAITTANDAAQYDQLLREVC